jgi:thiol-disulfide isomerase/thioredoxin
MLKTTAQRLTLNELDALRTALSNPQEMSGVEMRKVRLSLSGPPESSLITAMKFNLPRAPIYDPKANAKDEIATALLAAKRENKRVMIEFGGNWCGACYRLYDVLKKDAKVSAILNQSFVLVLVDVSSNHALYERYVEADERLVPILTVLDADGKVLRNQRTGQLGKNSEPESDYDITKVIGFLQQCSSN